MRAEAHETESSLMKSNSSSVSCCPVLEIRAQDPNADVPSPMAVIPAYFEHAHSPNSELVEGARVDGSVILTFDLDFGDILALGILDNPSVIIFRLADQRADAVNQRLAAVLTERHADLESGALILVEDSR